MKLIITVFPQTINKLLKEVIINGIDSKKIYVEGESGLKKLSNDISRQRNVIRRSNLKELKKQKLKKEYITAWFTASSLEECKEEVNNLLESNSLLFLPDDNKSANKKLKDMDIKIIFAGHGRVSDKKRIKFYGKEIKWDIIGKMANFIFSMGGRRICNEHQKNILEILTCWGGAPSIPVDRKTGLPKNLKDNEKYDPIYIHLIPFLKKWLPLKIKTFVTPAMIDTNTFKSVGAIESIFNKDVIDAKIPPLIADIKDRGNYTLYWGENPICKDEELAISKLLVILTYIYAFQHAINKIDAKISPHLEFLWKGTVGHIQKGKFQLALPLGRRVLDGLGGYEKISELSKMLRYTYTFREALNKIDVEIPPYLKCLWEEIIEFMRKGKFNDASLLGRRIVDGLGGYKVISELSKILLNHMYIFYTFRYDISPRLRLFWRETVQFVRIGKFNDALKSAKLLVDGLGGYNYIVISELSKIQRYIYTYYSNKFNGTIQPHLQRLWKGTLEHIQKGKYQLALQLGRRLVDGLES